MRFGQEEERQTKKNEKGRLQLVICRCLQVAV